MLTLNVYQGDLGLDGGTPTSVYTLDPSGMEQMTGGDAGVDAIELKPGESAELPNGLGTVTFDDARNPDAGEGDYAQSVPRFASFDIHHDPSQLWVLVFAALVLGGLLMSLFVPRRRVWVKASAPTGVLLEYAGSPAARTPASRRRTASPTSTGPTAGEALAPVGLERLRPRRLDPRSSTPT